MLEMDAQDKEPLCVVRQEGNRRRADSVKVLSRQIRLRAEAGPRFRQVSRRRGLLRGAEYLSQLELDSVG